MNYLCEFLKQKRIDAGLTQKDVADAFNLTSVQFVSNWERGLCSPPLNYFPLLCKILKINKHQLIEIALKQARQEIEDSFINSRKRA